LQEKQPLNLPEQVRVSLGTAIVLGLLEGKLDAKPTTAYFMTFKQGKCTANCGFCPQARASKSNADLLSRVSWPTFSTPNVITALEKAFKQGQIKRVCFQALNYPTVFSQLETLVKEIKHRMAIPVSVSCQPLNAKNIEVLANAGVNRLGVALDAATEVLFDKIKGEDAGSSYTWQNQFRILGEALRVFGRGKVSTHVIVGLGETEKDAVQVIQRCVDIGVLPALFAFTPVRGTALENTSPPSVESYRRVQLARFLITNGLAKCEDMWFDDEGKITNYGVATETLKPIIAGGKPFLTSGCPDCNRPFYNEKPSGPLYNYPRKLNKKELKEIKQQLGRN
jgi:lipoyl synthase